MIRNKIILDLLVQKAKKDFKKVLEAEKLDGGLSFVLTLGDIPQKIELECKLTNHGYKKDIDVFLTIDKAPYRDYLSPMYIDDCGWVVLSQYKGVKVEPLNIPSWLIKYIGKQLGEDISSSLKEEIARCKKLKEQCRKTTEALARRPQYEFMHF